MVKELKNYPHLAIIRTLSKAFALAGLRCGFTLANPELIQILQKVIAPYPLPVPVADIAAQALQPKAIEIMQMQVQQILQNRQLLASELAKLDCVEEVFSSEGNYLLVKFKDGKKVFDSLWQQGIILRNQHHALGLENCIRITIGSAEEIQRTLTAIQSI